MAAIDPLAVVRRWHGLAEVSELTTAFFRFLVLVGLSVMAARARVRGNGGARAPLQSDAGGALAAVAEAWPLLGGESGDQPD
jgi:hypothetical protein